MQRGMLPAPQEMEVVLYPTLRALSITVVAGMLLLLAPLTARATLNATPQLEHVAMQFYADYRECRGSILSPEILGKDSNMAMQIEGRRGPRKPARASRPVSRGVDTGRMFGPPSSPVQGPPRPVVPAKPNSGAVVGPKIFGPAATRAPSMPPISSAPARVPSTGSGSGLGTGSTGGIAAFGGGGFGGGGEMGFAGAPEAPAPPPMSEEDFLAQDAEFNDTRGAAEREYQNLLAQIARQRGEYELDNKNALRNLGWEGNGWDQQDRLTGYGQAFQNQLGDFASRGMLDSSLYGGALNDLNRGFNRQRDDLTSALQQFLQGQETDRTQAEAEKTAAITAAQRQALARMAAQFGGI